MMQGYTSMVIWENEGKQGEFCLTSTRRALTNLCFSLEDLSLLADETILEICHWFIENGNDIDVLKSIGLNIECAINLEILERKVEAVEQHTQDDCVLELAQETRLALAKARMKSGTEPTEKIHLYQLDSGWVYILRADNGVYKIGKTKELDKRMASLEVKLPYDLELVMAISSDDVSALESELHTMYKPKRLKGEWFDLDEADLAFLESLKAEYEQGGID